MKEYKLGNKIFRPAAIVYLPRKIQLWFEIKMLEYSQYRMRKLYAKQFLKFFNDINEGIAANKGSQPAGGVHV